MALLTVATIYVISRVGPQVTAARKILSGSITKLSAGDIDLAQDHLHAAHAVLDGFPAGVLRLIPVERQNVDAVRTGVDQTLLVLEQARLLRLRLDRLERGGLIKGGRISLKEIRGLQEPLDRAAASVTTLVATLRAHLSGWLMPTIWDGMTSTVAKAQELKAATVRGNDVAKLAPSLLGADSPRRYLVLLVNNAEVRPSGGILSGIGTVTLDKGRIRLGAFHYYTDLIEKPYRPVPAPPDYQRRYGRYKANSTHWVNVTLSPDSEEVADVASRLYRLTTGTVTDGAFLLDPRGVAALLPKHAHVHVPGTHTTLVQGDLTRYVYYRAYRQLGGFTTARHNALIAIGKAAFKDLETSGLGGGQRQVTAAARALAGGHIRFVSFTPREEDVLRPAGVTGAVEAGPGDRLFVTATNFNGTKLDYYSHQTITHTCDIAAAGSSLCETAVTLRNDVPPGLSPYVAGAHPYGQLRSFLEVYVPRAAVLQRVLLDGREAAFGEQPQSGLKSIGVEVGVAPGGARRLVVDYSLPAQRGGYTLQVTPAPLTHNAVLHIALRIPVGWKVSGRSQHRRLVGNVYEQAGELTHPQTLRVAPAPLRGISSLWQSFDNFLHRPVF